MVQRLVAVVALTALIVIAGATPAAAHGGSVESTDYLARITDVPDVKGLDVRLVEAGGRVELTNRSGDDVVVLGYEEEPYLRVGTHGVFENRNSPAVYLNASRTGGEPVPDGATAEADARWVRIADGTTVRWHDHRLHWMTADPEAVQDDPGTRHRVAEWELPLRVGGQGATVRGEIIYVPGPPVWPWLAAAALLAAVVVAAVRRHLLAAVVSLLVLADVVRVAGLTFVLASGGGERFQQAVDVGTVSAVGWGLGIVAVVRLLGGHHDGRVAAGLTGIVLGVTGGILEWNDIGRSQLAFAYPGDVARACVTVATGLGFGLAAAVLLQTARPTGAARPAAR